MVTPWLFALLLVLIAVAVGLALAGRIGDAPLRRRSRTDDDGPRRVANSAALLSSPLVRARIRRRRWLHAVLGALLVVAVVAASALAGRPVDRHVRNEALASRDIVLCLDVSTSMLTTDAKILDTFSQMLDTFDGERVALVAWNTTAQTMVPLTDDYDLLRSQLTKIADVLDFEPYYGNPKLNAYYKTFSGVFDTDLEASSLDGDGLASCTAAFGDPVKDRSRSVILATDNQVLDPDSQEIYSLSEAADLAAKRGVRIFSLYGADPDLQDPGTTQADLDRARQELKEVTTSHHGRFYEVDDADAAGGIVKELESDQVEELTDNTQVRVSDTPQLAGGVLAIALLLLLGLGAWRRA